MNARAGKCALGVVVALLNLSILAGCDRGSGHASPTAVPPPPPTGTSFVLPPLQSDVPNFIGDFVAESGGCNLPAGSTRTGVLWLVQISGSSIVLLEDMANYPTDNAAYVGTLQGRAFSAVSEAGGCVIRGSMTGTFSEDFSSFEAVTTWETLPSFPIGSNLVRRWSVRSL